MGFDASLPLLGNNNQQLINECRIHINGMTCNSCVKSIEGMISTKEGVTNIQVNLEEKEGFVKFYANKVTPEEIAEQIEDMGFDAYVKSVNGKSPNTDSPNKSTASKIVKKENGDVGTNWEKCQLHIKGMTCGSCVAAIEKHVLKIQGILKNI